jgi:type IV pilus assembly protein PilM
LEIQKTFDFFRATTVGEQLQRVYVSGGCAKVEGFLDVLQTRLGIPVEMFDPFKNIAIGKNVDFAYLDEIAPSMAVAVGLALRSFDN